MDAGWYVDPFDRSSGRYWDGTGWTEHTVDVPPDRSLPRAGEAPAAVATATRLPPPPPQAAPWESEPGRPATPTAIGAPAVVPARRLAGPTALASLRAAVGGVLSAVALGAGYAAVQRQAILEARWHDGLLPGMALGLTAWIVGFLASDRGRCATLLSALAGGVLAGGAILVATDVALAGTLPGLQRYVGSTAPVAAAVAGLVGGAIPRGLQRERLTSWVTGAVVLAVAGLALAAGSLVADRHDEAMDCKAAARRLAVAAGGFEEVVGSPPTDEATLLAFLAMRSEAGKVWWTSEMLLDRDDEQADLVPGTTRTVLAGRCADDST